jgi:two-component system sensor histidine kinase KdpD
LRAVAVASATTALATMVGTVLASFGESRNLALVFIPAVLYASISRGQAAGVAAALLGVVSFNFFFMEPYIAFGIYGVIDVLTLAVLLAVAVITASLASRAREHARAAEAERFSVALLGSISHDIRTPLATILGAATTLLSHARLSPSDRDDLLTGIRDEAMRLDRFVGKLLDMTRLQSGHLKPNIEPMELADLVGTAVAKLRQRLRQHAVTVELPAELPLVALDPVLMEQVLENLLDNAARHTPAGRRIRIAAHPEGRRVELAIEDEGEGIPADDRARVFDKFFAVKRPGRRGAGTGLGLTICRGFVEAHGGSIKVGESSLGGARFVISLPVA